jgi:hypothetical protein
LVIRSRDIERSAGFYACLGIEFTEEQHDQGPRHYAAQVGNMVMEIYPCGDKEPTTDLRLGFLVPDMKYVEMMLSQLSGEDVKVRSDVVNENGRGKIIGIVKDPDGNTVALSKDNRPR